MQKRSVLTKIIILVMLALIVPAAFGQNVACWSPACVDSCPAGTYDCTTDWAMTSWDNFYTLMGMYMNGITPLVCCM